MAKVRVTDIFSSSDKQVRRRRRIGIMIPREISAHMVIEPCTYIDIIHDELVLQFEAIIVNQNPLMGLQKNRVQKN